jgi:hypothetical protein
MFEKVSEYLESGLKERVIGFVILFVPVYSIIWNLIEPISVSDIIKDSWVLKNWWIFQISLSVVISGIIFYSILPKKILERFGLEARDTHLINGARIPNETQKPTITEDGFLGKVVNFDMPFSSHIDWDIKPIAQFAKSVSFICSPDVDFTLYLRIEAISGNGSKTRSIWIAMKQSIHKPEGDNIEWGHPLKLNHFKNRWYIGKISLNKIVKDTCGKDGWKLRSLQGFRIRGKSLFHSLTLR